MMTASITQAKIRPSRLIKKAQRGESIIIFDRSLECISAIARRQREEAAQDVVSESYRRLEMARAGWQEVHASASLHCAAVRLLNTVPLSASGASQLGVALIANNFEAHSAPFLAESPRFRQAAEKEGFLID